MACPALHHSVQASTGLSHRHLCKRYFYFILFFFIYFLYQYYLSTAWHLSNNDSVFLLFPARFFLSLCFLLWFFFPLFVGFFFFLSLSFFLWVLLSDHDDDEVEVEDDDDEHDSYKDNRNRHIQLINWSQRALLLQAALKSGLPDLDVKQTDAENWCSILNELIHFDWHSHFLTKYWVTEYFFLCVSIRPGNVTLRTFREPVRRQKVLQCFITNSIPQLVVFVQHVELCVRNSWTRKRFTASKSYSWFVFVKGCFFPSTYLCQFI